MDQIQSLDNHIIIDWFKRKQIKNPFSKIKNEIKNTFEVFICLYSFYIISKGIELKPQEQSAN